MPRSAAPGGRRLFRCVARNCLLLALKSQVATRKPRKSRRSGPAAGRRAGRLPYRAASASSAACSPPVELAKDDARDPDGGDKQGEAMHLLRHPALGPREATVRRISPDARSLSRPGVRPALCAAAGGSCLNVEMLFRFNISGKDIWLASDADWSLRWPPFTTDVGGSAAQRGSRDDRGDDPLALEPGEKIVALCSIRNDPLARLHSRGRRGATRGGRFRRQCRHPPRARARRGRIGAGDDVLVKGMTMEQIGAARLCTQRWKDYFARRFQECLDRLWR